MKENKEKIILQTITTKAKLKQKIYENTLGVMKQLHKVLKILTLDYNKKLSANFDYDLLKYKKINKFQSELKVAGDMLIFKMHTNIFDFDRGHAVRKMPYVHNNEYSTYCGVINIYNFLADSFKYNRSGDLGYLVGRVFINKDKFYFVEERGKISQLFNTFGQEKISDTILKSIVDTVIAYCLDFDLLVPPYDANQVVRVDNILESRENSKLETGKRLGFQFNHDDFEGKKSLYTGG